MSLSCRRGRRRQTEAIAEFVWVRLGYVTLRGLFTLAYIGLESREGKKKIFYLAVHLPFTFVATNAKINLTLFSSGKIPRRLVPMDPP